MEVRKSPFQRQTALVSDDEVQAKPGGLTSPARDRGHGCSRQKEPVGAFSVFVLFCFSVDFYFRYSGEL